MLRACHEVSKPGGRIAGYTIHTPPGLTPRKAERAAELGPSEVLDSASPTELLGTAGFRVTLQEDVTATLSVTLAALLAAMQELEGELRRDEGDAEFEDWRERRRNMLQGVQEGLLLRSLHVAVKEL